MVLLYLLTDGYEEGTHSFRHFDDFLMMIDCLSATDFRVVITSWNHILIQDQRVILDYYIEVQDGKFISHTSPLEIEEPRLILDECPGTEERVIACLHIQKLQKFFWKKSFFTYHPVIATIGKCMLETYFQWAEINKGIRVNRPRTWICHSLLEASTLLHSLLQSPDSLYILKSDTGTRSEAVFVISQKNVDSILSTLSDTSYVIQEYLINTVLFNTKKADLRVNVAVYSWYPLEIDVFHEAKVRVARDHFSANDALNPHVGITARATYTQAQDYLSSYSETDQLTIWNRIEQEIHTVLLAIFYGARLDENANIQRTVSLIGVDIILQDSDTLPQPMILEINPKPGKFTVTHSETALIDDLKRSYRRFFEKIQERL